LEVLLANPISPVDILESFVQTLNSPLHNHSLHCFIPLTTGLIDPHADEPLLHEGIFKLIHHFVHSSFYWSEYISSIQKAFDAGLRVSRSPEIVREIIRVLLLISDSINPDIFWKNFEDTIFTVLADFRSWQGIQSSEQGAVLFKAIGNSLRRLQHWLPTDHLLNTSLFRSVFEAEPVKLETFYSIYHRLFEAFVINAEDQPFLRPYLFEALGLLVRLYPVGLTKEYMSRLAAVTAKPIPSISKSTHFEALYANAVVFFFGELSHEHFGPHAETIFRFLFPLLPSLPVFKLVSM
jgi:hypothetical protein